jgi:hypothetical protein
MATLDKIMQMQQEGKSENEIMAQMQQEGVSPSEVNDGLNQAKVKNAVSPPEQLPPQLPPPATPEAGIPQQPTAPPTQQQPEIYPAAPQTIQPQEAQPQEAQPQEEYYTPQPQAYSNQDYYPQSGGYETDTISEIAEQVVTEKLEDYKSKVGDIPSFKSEIQTKVNDIDDRLKRIEGSIDKLQQAILGKIGEFGESSAMIHKDLDNLHGTVAKLMNPLIDSVNEMKKLKK